jgi:nicotinamide riboside transporter PnuC
VDFNLSMAIYGTIMIGALLAAETAKRETYARTVGAVLIALAIYWLAHSYAEFTSRRLRESRPFTVGGFVHGMIHELPILLGASLPLVALLLWWIFGAPLTSAVNASIWTSAGTIFAIEVAAGLRTSNSLRQWLVQTTVGLGLGLLIIALKLVLH